MMNAHMGYSLMVILEFLLQNDGLSEDGLMPRRVSID